MAGVAVLLLAGFAPFALLRMVPVVEAAAMAHLEGLSRRPFEGTRRSMALAASGVGLVPEPIRAAVGLGGRGDDDVGAGAVGAAMFRTMPGEYVPPDQDIGSADGGGGGGEA